MAIAILAIGLKAVGVGMAFTCSLMATGKMIPLKTKAIFTQGILVGIKETTKMA